MADKSLDVLIRIISEEVGQEKADVIIKRIKDAAKEQGEQDVAASGKAKDATKELFESKEELRHSISHLTREFPLLGNVAKAAMGHVVAGVSLALYSIRKLSEQIKETLILLEEEAPWKGFADSVDASKDALDEATVSASSFWNEINRGATEQEALKEKTEQLIDALHRQMAAEAELRNAEKAKEIAQINSAEKGGQISPIDAIQRRAAIEKKYAQADRNAKVSEKQKELDALADENQHLKDQLESLTADAAGKIKSAAQAKSSGAAEAKNRDIYKANIASADEKIAKLEAELEARDRFGMRSGIYDTFTDKYIQSEIESYKATRSRSAAALGKLDAGKLPNDIARQAEIDAAAAAQRDLEAVKAAEKESRDKVNSMRMQIEEEKAHNKKVGQVEDQTRQIEASDAIREVQQKSKKDKEDAAKRNLEDLKSGRSTGASISTSAAADAVIEIGKQIEILTQTVEKVASQTTKTVAAANSRIQNSYLT